MTAKDFLYYELLNLQSDAPVLPLQYHEKAMSMITKEKGTIRETEPDKEGKMIETESHQIGGGSSMITPT